MSFLSTFFGRHSGEDLQPAGSAVISSQSKTLQELQFLMDRRLAEGGTPQVLLVGPPTGSLIEVFNQRGGRVTVEGEDRPSLPLALDDESFDIILAFDLLDFLPDDDVMALAKDWARVLKPGGRVFLVARSTRDRSARRFRPEGGPDGSLVLVPRQESSTLFHPRANAEWHKVTGALELGEIVLRRDGLREISLKRAGILPPAAVPPAQESAR